MQFRALPAALLLLVVAVLHPAQHTYAQILLNQFSPFLHRGFGDILATGQLPSPAVEVTGGTVRGVALSNGVLQFTGIPFAKPPTRENDLRWRAPVAPDSWNGTIDLTNWAPICAQFTMGKTDGEEDCLYLNVWTTQTPNSSRAKDEDNPDGSPAEARANVTEAIASEVKLKPVMVWIHGGGFQEGSTQSYNGSNLLEQLDGSIVYVSTPYRLGPFGFLGSEALRSRTVGDFGGTTGNYGLLDQRFALEWVKENIAQFGGDPDKVTIFGQSAGGGSVSSHMSMPGSRGLYHRAIIESSSFTPNVAKTLLSAEGVFTNYTAILNCPSEGDAAVTCLNRHSTFALCEAVADLPECCDFSNIFIPWAPVVDGTELPLHPWEAAGGGVGADGQTLRLFVDDDLPILHGDVRDEGALFLESAPAQLSFPGLIARWSVNYGPDVVRNLTDIYLPAQSPDVFHSDFYFADSRALGDFWAICSAWRMSERQTALGRPVWEYNFEAVDPFSFHGTEIPFVFQDQIEKESNGGMEDARQLSIKIANYWANFAATGNPNQRESESVERQPLWPRFGATEGGSILTLDLEGTQAHATEGLLADRCNFWIPYLEVTMLECKVSFPCGNKPNTAGQLPTMEEREQEGRQRAQEMIFGKDIAELRRARVEGAQLEADANKFPNQTMISRAFEGMAQTMADLMAHPDHTNRKFGGTQFI